MNIFSKNDRKDAGFLAGFYLGFISTDDYFCQLFGVHMISNVDCTRLAMPSESDDSQRDPDLKRKAWLAVFGISTLFWIGIALLVWTYWG